MDSKCFYASCTFFFYKGLTTVCSTENCVKNEKKNGRGEGKIENSHVLNSCSINFFINVSYFQEVL